MAADLGLGERAAAPVVLLAEDEVLSRRLTEKVLLDLGCRVLAVADGEAAVEEACRESFDLILMDCQMPRLDGFKATAAIRWHERTTGGKRTPIVGLSGRNMDGDAEIALSKGMDEYVTKPTSRARLREVVERWTEKRGATEP